MTARQSLAISREVREAREGMAACGFSLADIEDEVERIRARPRPKLYPRPRKTCEGAEQKT